MTNILFLLCPVLFGALYWLIGQTIHWFKNQDELDESVQLIVVTETGRK